MSPGAGTVPDMAPLVPATERRRTGAALPGAVLAALLGAVVAVVLGATPVAAHQPVFVDDATPAADSPVLEDGTISFATYGRITAPDRTAVVRVRHQAGERLTVELLVPDRPPENTFAAYDVLRVRVTDPFGEVTDLVPDGVLGRFDEPFSKTSYLRLLSWEADAVEGITTVEVSASVPTRFTLATGTIEAFGAEVSSYEPQPVSELAAWYATPPPTAPDPPPTEEPGGTVAPTTSTAPGASAAGDGSAAAAGDEQAGAVGGDGPGAGGVNGVVVALAVVGVAAGVAGAVSWRRRDRTSAG